MVYRVYNTQVGRPLPKPLSPSEKGFADGSPSLIGKGLGVRFMFKTTIFCQVRKR